MPPFFSAYSRTFFTYSLSDSSPSSLTFAPYITSLFVRNRNSRLSVINSSLSFLAKVLTGLLDSKWAKSSCAMESCAFAPFCALLSFCSFSMRLLRLAISAKSSSSSIISISLIGSIRPSICVILESSKHRTICKIISASLMFAKN